MNDDERRLHDWLDEELDRMAIGGDRPVDPRRVFASETDRALYETAADLRRLDAKQSSEPSAGFLNHLEKQLMMKNDAAPAHGQPLTGSRRRRIDLVGGNPLPAPPARQSNLWAFTTMALVLMVVAGTIGITRLAGNGAGDAPTQTTGAIALQASGTPDDPVTTAPIGDELAAVAPLAPGENADIAWQLTIPIGDGVTGAYLGKTVLANGMVYRQIRIDAGDEGDAWTIDDKGNRELVHEGLRFDGVQAIDAATGKTVWKYYFGFGRAGLEADANGVYSVTVPNEIIALGAADGNELWTARFNGLVVATALRNGTLYVWDTTYTLTAVDTQTGATQWSASIDGSSAWRLGTDGTPWGSSVLVASDTAIAAVSADSRLLVFDRADGTLLWEQADYDVNRTYLVGTDAVLLATTSRGESTEQNPVTESIATAYDFATGEQLWTLTGDRLGGSITVAAGSNMFVVAGDELAIDSPAEAVTPLVDFEEDGSNSLWSAEGAESVWGDSENTGDFVFGLDANTGQIVWQRSAIAGGFWAAYAAPGNATQVVALTDDNQIVLLDAATGQILAAAITIDRVNPVNTLTVGSAAEGVFVATRGGVFYSFWQTID